ncbi:hypothetical protein JCM17380_23990 [Desulfosporosinus burensis]
MAVIRYVHHNPIKAKMVESPEHYMWSSYQWYMDPDEAEGKLVDAQYIEIIEDHFFNYSCYYGNI